MAVFLLKFINIKNTSVNMSSCLSAAYSCPGSHSLSDSLKWIDNEGHVYTVYLCIMCSVCNSSAQVQSVHSACKNVTY